VEASLVPRGGWSGGAWRGGTVGGAVEGLRPPPPATWLGMAEWGSNRLGI
jgi:hypothetical protein